MSCFVEASSYNCWHFVFIIIANHAPLRGITHSKLAYHLQTHIRSASYDYTSQKFFICINWFCVFLRNFSVSLRDFFVFWKFLCIFERFPHIMFLDLKRTIWILHKVLFEFNIGEDFLIIITKFLASIWYEKEKNKIFWNIKPYT